MLPVNVVPVNVTAEPDTDVAVIFGRISRLPVLVNDPSLGLCTNSFPVTAFGGTVNVSPCAGSASCVNGTASEPILSTFTLDRLKPLTSTESPAWTGDEGTITLGLIVKHVRRERARAARGR